MRATFPLARPLPRRPSISMAPGRTAEPQRCRPPPGCGWLYGLRLPAGDRCFSPRPDDALYWGAAYLAVLVLDEALPAGGRSARWPAAPQRVQLARGRRAAPRPLRRGPGHALRGREPGLECLRRRPGRGAGRRCRDVTLHGDGAVRSGARASSAWSSVSGATGFKRLLWFAAILPSLVLLYIMESRGAAVSFVAACAFVLLFHGRAARWTGRDPARRRRGRRLRRTDSPERRGGGRREVPARADREEQLTSLTGRTRAWDKAMVRDQGVPARGLRSARGPVPDQGARPQHLLLHAALRRPFGTGFFVGGPAAGLAPAPACRAPRGRHGRGDHWTTVLQVGGILVFFTARSVPEVSGAMFGVDTMLMVPALSTSDCLRSA